MRVSGTGFFEVKQDWQVSKLSQPLTDRIQHLLPFGGEPAENEHSLLTDRVDDIAEFRAAQEQVYKLSDFYIVDLNCPDDSVLFLVDFVSFRRLPNREMDYELGQWPEWMAAIKKAEALAAGFKFVATGHGPVGTVKDITAWREYFEKLQNAVAAGIKAGQTLEQMQQSIKMAEYSHWDGFD